MQSIQSGIVRVASALGSALPAQTAPALLGAGACRLRGLSSASRPLQDQAKPQPTMVDLEYELDRDDPDAADKEHLWDVAQKGPPPAVDLETEFDRDDPEMADTKTLWEALKAEPPPEVDLDTEFDRDDPLLADKRFLWECPEPPCPANIDSEYDLMEESEKAEARSAARSAAAGESPGGTMAGNTTPFGQEVKRGA
ncbi:dehydrogenase reductase isoform B [Micractinium conductrix]|uniref:Dehydrogenase reductase isoform B n=1 Tax=Micractinium conductrix TaxID=554055 RepID=A0A2P6V753_9CHLO|nr:dehydrogenase reductase isoform B [Micractinium conductrix]|eukprot:PSC69908.1 dehydrogenase reductase isoform B [Micractinium conductrix]